MHLHVLCVKKMMLILLKIQSPLILIRNIRSSFAFIDKILKQDVWDIKSNIQSAIRNRNSAIIIMSHNNNNNNNNLFPSLV